MSDPRSTDADLSPPDHTLSVEFFTANIRNPHTRRAYARACVRFFAWCERRGLALATIRPYDVAQYIDGLQKRHSAPGVKQQLAAVACCSIGSSPARSCRPTRRRPCAGRSMS